jgi:hypothetical protein
MELLRAATLGPVAAAAAWGRWIATHVVDEASDRSVGLLAAVGANVPDEALGDEAGRLRGLRRRSWTDTQVRLAGAAGALDVLREVGITPIVTGGAALVTATAAAPGTRPLGAIDLVLGDPLGDTPTDTPIDECTPTDERAPGGTPGPPSISARAVPVSGTDDALIDALAALGAAGWARVRPVDSPFDHIVDVVDPAGRRIRLHRWVLFPRLAAVPERARTQRAVSHEVAGRTVRRFRLADELVATVLSGLLNPPVALLRWPLAVIDLAHAGAGESEADVFWREVVASATDLGAGPLLSDAFALCRIDLDAPISADVVDELAATRCDPELRRSWALRRRGVAPERRVMRYRRIAHEAGAAPTPWGYARARTAAVRATGLRPAIRARVERATTLVSERRRD